LVEVLVATVVLSIGLVGAASMMVVGAISHDKSAYHTFAANRAEAELERIREARYLGDVVGTALFPSPAYTILNATQVSFDVPELPGGRGLITLAEDVEAQAIDPGTGHPYHNLKLAQVQITWTGGRLTRGSYGAATLIANRP
jgi:hypothetical protein